MKKDDSHINQNLADAIRRVSDLLGGEAFCDYRSIGALKDFHAFRNMPAAELIMKMMLEKGSFKRILSGMDDDIAVFSNLIETEISRITTRYGFSEVLLNTVISSFLTGYDKKIDLKQTAKKPEQEKKSKENKPQQPVSNNPFDIRTIDFNLSDSEIRKHLISITDSDSDDEDDIEPFKCSLTKKRKVYVDIDFGEITLSFMPIRTPRRLHNAYKELTKYLTEIYGDPHIEIKCDVESYFNYIEQWNYSAWESYEYTVKLIAYQFSEGTVLAQLVFKPYQYHLSIQLIPRDSETSEMIYWRKRKKKTFNTLYPLIDPPYYEIR